MTDLNSAKQQADDDITWLARNVHRWIDGDYLIRVGNIGYTFREHCEGETALPNWYTRDQWLTRRAKLQNKPSWKDAPEWAEWLAQDEDGEWKWLAGPSGRYVDGWTAIKIKGCCKGLAIGDWRDTLERRPQVEAEITDPFDPEFRQEPSPSGLAVEVISTLKKTPSYFSSNELMSICSLIGDELNKRDAAVCGGQKYIDATWFERRDLPPVGTTCVFSNSDKDDAGRPRPRNGSIVTIVNHHQFCDDWTAVAVYAWVDIDEDGEEHGFVSTGTAKSFRPLQTERERIASELVDVMMAVPVSDRKTASESYMSMALAIYDHLHPESRV